MSCFVVSDFHVSALVAWGFHNRALVGISPDALAHELASANRAAFAERYEGRYQDDVAPFAGLDLDADRALDPIGVVKACDCLAYQASDWAGWDACEAAAHLAAIQAAALYRATGGTWQGSDAYNLPGYDAAAWCLDAPEPEPDPAAELARVQRMVGALVGAAA